MPFDPATARAWVDVDLDALTANARVIAAISGAPLLPMVKANGYGLGAIEVARALLPLDPWGFGVATVEEGTALRAAGIDRPVLVVSPLLPDDARRCLDHDLRPTLGDPASLDAWIGRTDHPFHVEIDTGMGRAGIRWDDGPALDVLRDRLGGASGWEGVYTHFHSAETDSRSMRRQWERFQETLARLPRRPALVHAANSAAAACGPMYAADLIRPGIFLYGGAAGSLVPRSVAALRARVVGVRSVGPGDPVSYGATWHASRPTTVATLAVGYADGFPRATGGEVAAARPPRLVELRGRMAPVIGRVTMDLTMVEAAGDVAVGDVATLYGGSVSLDQQAAAAGTISYELLTWLGARVPRRYRRG